MPVKAEKFNDFSYNGRSIIKKNYSKIPGIYLWVNNVNSRCYVGKSINLYLRFSKYLSPSYIKGNKTKMAICSAISKYDIDNFTFYVLETFDRDIVSQKYLSVAALPSSKAQKKIFGIKILSLHIIFKVL